ncbi:MAG: hypothetical protein GXY34_00735 [Syntrophomonadaceae bacterium]|nr:hypothetical protein [Syntrophomonadaceae bacterium]
MFEIRKIQEQVLFSAIKSASNDKTASGIVYVEHEEDDATWVKSTMARLENCFDSSEVRQIRMNCQCGYGIGEKLALVKELVAASSSMEEFGSLEKSNAAGMFCSGGELFLQFSFCPCPILADVDKLDTYAWCQCTTGYSKVLFEEAFGCEVDVELLKSIKVGDEICLMKIIPLGTVWK